MVDEVHPVAERLHRVARVSRQIADLSLGLDLAVCHAREAGAAWADIAGVLGCSPQAAHKRFRWLRRNAAGVVWREPPLSL